MLSFRPYFNMDPEGALKRTIQPGGHFARQPSPASQKQALVILQTLYGGLVDAGYLVANPFRSIMKSFNLPASKMDIKRSFTEKNGPMF